MYNVTFFSCQFSIYLFCSITLEISNYMTKHTPPHGVMFLVTWLTRKLLTLMEHRGLLISRVFYWVMSLTDRYQSFGGPCCLHLQDTKPWHLSVKLHGVVSFSYFAPVLLCYRPSHHRRPIFSNTQYFQNIRCHMISTMQTKVCYWPPFCSTLTLSIPYFCNIYFIFTMPSLCNSPKEYIICFSFTDCNFYAFPISPVCAVVLPILSALV
jgi:hypothetical protein